MHSIRPVHKQKTNREFRKKVQDGLKIYLHSHPIISQRMDRFYLCVRAHKAHMRSVSKGLTNIMANDEVVVAAAVRCPHSFI